MRVLIVTTSYPSRRAPHNGLFIREHCHALRDAGVEVFVLAPHVFAEDPADMVDDGVPVHRFPYWSGQRLLNEFDGIPVFRMASYLLSGAVAGARMARRVRPDVVHGHWVIPAGLVAAVANALSVRRPLVVTAHGSDVKVALSGSAVARSLARWTLARATRVVAVSTALRDRLVAGLGAGPGRVDVVPMGVDTEAFAPSDMTAARAALGLAQDARIALFVGGLIPLKGVRDLVEAMPLVLPGDPSVLLVLAGYGPLEAELAARAASIGQASRVRLLGPVPHDDLPTWMNAADVLVLPSHSEGLPVCLMEAAAVGLPMVATDVGGSAEVLALDARNRLVAPGDVPGLAAALSDALAAPRGPRPSMLADAPRFTRAGSLDATLRLYAGLSEPA